MAKPDNSGRDIFPATQRVRLDQLLVERGLYDTRSRARDAVARGAVKVDGVIQGKPGAATDPAASLEIADPAKAYVSRAALKLVAGLDAFGFDPTGRTALDIGASTGGFTQVLLERGAAHVIAVDVGHGQLHPAIAGDARVISLEGLNARELSADHLDGREIDSVVSDVSFISLRLALPPALDMARAGAFAVLLVKPQFEAGRAAIGKGGILKDPAAGERIARDLHDWLAARPGWQATGIVPSPISGGDGNQEFLIGGLKA
ncbi:23S rRNA (cytidine1920-2'-O)/16S rRNA (cytidine1409-2'-O)-methyltransferase [Hoeflea marina]|uniref:23S rRNA (Cytidine1920-2'-O)/16S rRNA (Cytidine1409-2'-O)-methyltransferase n=1 Tax=Hoeflea marina TaxID=274592 RepID=A0A317PM67_9HYPH|nr:TlyA family RNA methyltransferase [Hoeflea marina]PWW01836.1 23S rRNA (cytidine1920-2'-O)/16S rRNA (cytidine1409-2'-O)-methyltransferase [Hoeflea marina]